MDKQKVLIIEDDLIDQMAFTRLFDQSELDIDYTVVSSIEKAKTQLTNHIFDLVVSDYNLADGTPFDLVEHLPIIPIILISGNEDKTIINNLILTCINDGQIEKIASLTKDINLDYLQELLNLTQIFLSEINPKAEPLKIATNKSSEKVFINLDNAYKIFDNNKKDIKETLEIFIQYKPIELQSLYEFKDKNDCEGILKVTHKMKSGFRLLGMKNQYDLLEELEKITEADNTNCNSRKVDIIVNQLSTDLEFAIGILKKEITLLR